MAERPDGIGVLFMAYATPAKFVINQRSNHEKGWTMINRRQFLKASGLAGAGLLVPWKGKAFAAIAGGSLDPVSIPKYQMPLVIPPAMPKTGRIGGADYYEIAVRQFQQQILPARQTRVLVCR